MGLFKRKNKEELKGEDFKVQARDKLVFIKVNERSDDELYKICDLLIDGKPVLANFDTLVASDCNYMLAFISGCAYAFCGGAFQIADRLFLFARGEELEDGSLDQWIEEHK